MLKRKTTYVPGQWNANTVLMGGLGKAPENEEESKYIYNHYHTIYYGQIMIKEMSSFQR